MLHEKWGTLSGLVRLRFTYRAVDVWHLLLDAMAVSVKRIPLILGGIHEIPYLHRVLFEL